MNIRKTMAVGMAVAALLAVAAQADTEAISLSARLHRAQEKFTDYPYSDNDLSYMAAWEVHTDDALLQFGADFCPKFKSDDAPDYAISPELNLLFKDGVFRGGGGLLSTYEKSDSDSKWMDLYWQFLLGFSFNLPAKLSLDVYAIYPFKDLSELGDFTVKSIEYSAGLAYHF